MDLSSSEDAALSGAFDKGSADAGNGWVTAAIERCKVGLKVARTTADRCALLRSLTRLLGGRLDLRRYAIELSADEKTCLLRFGLAFTNEDQALRLMDEEDLQNVDGLSAALVLDSRSRQVFEPASPDAMLLRLTKHPYYRTAAQKAAVRGLVTQPAGSGLMVSMPTGSGKSILFQIAASFEREITPGACSIVITPTVALALDHERTLSTLDGLTGSRAITGDSSPQQVDAILNDFRRGHVPILLLSPEKALNPRVLNYLVEAAEPRSIEFGLDARLTHVFIDEAHIIETWGRSFRPDFQRLPALLSRLRCSNPAIRAILLSATLPESARGILRQAWQFEGEWLEIDARLPRYEHDVVIGQFGHDQQRLEALDNVIDRAPRPLILYTTEIDAADTLHQRLTVERGYERIALFTGDTPARERRFIVDEWAKDAFDIMIATSAFGMGIDKPDVRSVVHACLPEGPARWYQEIGRASRDGGQGLAACLFVDSPTGGDAEMAYRLATSGWLSRELAEQRWLAMMSGSENRRWSGDHLFVSINLDAFREGLRPKAGDWNRGWNMTLLTLLQRAGVILVLSVPSETDQPEFVWDVEVLDHRLLNGVDANLWDQIVERRKVELAELKASLDVFVDTMRHPERVCITRAVFELIEPRSFAPPCGRCPSCRRMGIGSPSHIPAAGLEKSWRHVSNARCRLPNDVLLLCPSDPHYEIGFHKLISTLAECGIDQVVTPNELALQAANIMVSSSTRLGLVMSEIEWSGNATLAGIPTAVVLPDNDWIAEGMLDQLASFRQWAGVTTIIVAQPNRRLRGRRLDQTVSQYAPYSEDSLRSMVTSVKADE